MTHILHKIEDNNGNIEAILAINTSISKYQFKAMSEQVDKLTTNLIMVEVEIEHLKGKTIVHEKLIRALQRKAKNQDMGEELKASGFEDLGSLSGEE